MMGVLTPSIWKTSTCLTLPSVAPDLTTFTRLDELGLVVRPELGHLSRPPGPHIALTCDDVVG